MDFASYDYNFSDQIQHQDEHHVLENAHQFAWTLNDAPLATEVFLAPQQISAIVQNQQIPQQQQQQFMFVQQPVPVPIQQQQQKPFSVPNVVITQHHDHHQQHQIQQQPQQFLQIPQQQQNHHHHQIPQQSNAFSGSLPSSSATDNFFASVMQHQQQQHQIQQMQLQLQQQQQQFQHQHQQQPQFQHLHPLQHPNYELHNHGSSSSLLTIVSNSDSDEPNSSNTAPTSPASIGEFSVNLEPSSANTDQPTAVRVGVKQQRSNSTSSSSAQNRRLRQTRPKVVESKGAIQCKGKNRKKGTQCRNAALMEYIGPRPQYCAEHIELDPFSLYEKCKAGYQKERGDQKSLQGSRSQGVWSLLQAFSRSSQWNDRPRTI